MVVEVIRNECMSVVCDNNSARRSVRAQSETSSKSRPQPVFYCTGSLLERRKKKKKKKRRKEEGPKKKTSIIYYLLFIV